MPNELHLTTTVLPGNRIEIMRPDLPVGEEVEVEIRVRPRARAQPPAGGRSILDIIKSSPGRRLFKTAEEVDAYLREERDSWER